MAIVYEGHDREDDSEFEKPHPLTVEKGRPNGSLYSRQKRSIADACEWLRLNQTRDKKALIFCLTSPGFTSLANAPKFISSFFENMRANYGMGDYVWVREMTKAGFPHFHCVALWHPYKWFLDEREDGSRRITELSNYWASLFGVKSNNSIRLGSFHPKTKKRSFYLSNEKHAWYLSKYIGKSIGDSFDYLAEAGFPQLKYKKAVRSFGMSENVALLSHPELFSSYHMTVESKEVMTASGGSVTIQTKQRVFISDSGQLSEEQIKAYNWRWTGHGETYIGILRTRRRKPDLGKGAISPIRE